MSGYELKIKNDEVYSYYPLSQYGEGVAKKELVMTKEIFLECYKKWALGYDIFEKTGREVKEDA